LIASKELDVPDRLGKRSRQITVAENQPRDSYLYVGKNKVGAAPQLNRMLRALREKYMTKD
jgi:hypothetical protein